MEAVGEQNVRLAVAVEIAPRCRGQVIGEFLRQAVRIVLELPLAEIREESRTGRCREQEIGKAVAIVIGPHGRSRAAGEAG